MVYEYVAGKQIWPGGWTSLGRLQEYPDCNNAQSLTDPKNEFCDKTWFNGISVGVYPMSFAKDQEPYEESSGLLPEDTHVGLGPTRAEEAPAMSLLRVSRQVRMEFAAVLWGITIKRFNCLAIFKSVVQYLRKYCTRQEVLGHVFAPRDRWVLRRVFLSFSNYEYLKFLGYDICVGSTFGVSRRIEKGRQRGIVSGVKLLSDIHTLRHLNLQFQIMMPYRYYGDPEITPWDPWYSENEAPRSFCQKEVVDIILTLGYELLRGFRKVTISGDLKTSNHEKWDPLLRDQLPPGKPRERRDMTADVARILAMSDEELYVVSMPYTICLRYTERQSADLPLLKAMSVVVV
ncbi:hypothetical protein AA0119_g7444 [Alternaria tenuissima]|jgi:hypothetical protein|uniref:Uncharacterized protein n=2 Tax=Alternaria alternata complex TaxID=187734 RepID=A0A4V1WSI8_ALTAL|nr:hypothetical protein AA0115_g12317 [Alternaria tenuissima]RYN79685.1 hypothetical protein AA0117_g3465 [Alternaria alternata]RYN97413.1 hypothetical protein AA0119_g7444 [Alternaria tenuissima]RYO20818.1 hypothetical protein AA0121_g3315 [Alternaria tenuissima]